MLFKASTLDLIRRFNARRINDKYLIPIERTPWIVIYDIGEEVEISSVIVSGIRIEPPIDKPWAFILLAFLDRPRGMAYGVLIVGRAELGCRCIDLNPPLDLWELPRNVEFERLRAIAVESRYRGEASIRPPLECLSSLGIDVRGVKARHIVAYSNLISLGVRTVVDFSNVVIRKNVY